MKHEYNYAVNVTWTGNLGTGTSGYKDYSRNHEIRAAGKLLAASSDPAFRGDASRWNPEEMLVSALSACHMLWFLHLCADAGIVVESYEDNASGVLVTAADGGGRFTQVTLRPRVKAKGDAGPIAAVHERAHKLCFLANSVNFPVLCEPVARA